MNPDPPTKAMAPRGDESGWLRQLLRGAAADIGPRGARSYPDAVAGSSDPTRRRRVPYVNAAGETEWDPRAIVID